NGEGQLVVTFTEAGLGNGNINYLLTGSATATYACVNRGGNQPQAPQFTNVTAGVSQGASFESKNGKVTGTITVDPPPSGLNCPNGQTEKLFSVSYSGLTLQDSTNNIAVSPADASRSYSGGITP